jgi:hypothetical protein
MFFFSFSTSSSIFMTTVKGVKSGNKLQQRWLPDRRNVTTILPCAMRGRMTRRRDHPRRPGPVSRERFMGRVNRNHTIRASKAIYRRFCSLLVIISTCFVGIHNLAGACSNIGILFQRSRRVLNELSKTRLPVVIHDFETGTSEFLPFQIEAGSHFLGHCCMYRHEALRHSAIDKLSLFSITVSANSVHSVGHILWV